MEDFIYFSIALLFCISIHEFSHALVAYLLGDATAKNEGRLSLNPLRHLDILGTLMLLFARFGWGKPVPVNENNLNHPRRDSALVALAGPFSNLLTAFVCAVIFNYIPLPLFLLKIFQAIFTLSLVLFLFNLIPLAPLDGSQLVAAFIPSSKKETYARFMEQGALILIFVIIGDRLLQEISGFSLVGAYLQYGYEWLTLGLLFLT